jgi:hypothetical protein
MAARASVSRRSFLEEAREPFQRLLDPRVDAFDATRSHDRPR